MSALLVGSGLIASQAQAGYVVTLEEVGSDVFATGSGPINLTGLTVAFSGGSVALIGPIGGAILIGASPSIVPADAYIAITGPASSGPDLLKPPTAAAAADRY